MARTHQLEPIDVDFFDSAPITYRIDVNLPVTPARAWAELTRQNTLDWCRAIKSIEFTSPAPYGVGTTRRAALPGAGLSEHFFVWDEDAATGNYRNAGPTASKVFKTVEADTLRHFAQLSPQS